MQTTNEKNIISVAFGFVLFLAMIEFLIPKPIPFLKLGIANIPLIILSNKISFKNFMLLAFFKVIGASIYSGTILSPLFLMSFVGTISSALVMFSVANIFKDRVSYVGISVAGAFVSDCFRIAVAALLMSNSFVIMVAPLVLGVGIVAAMISGILAKLFSRNNDFMKADFRCENLVVGSSNGTFFFFLAIVSIICFIFQDNLYLLIFEYLLILLFSFVKNRKVKLLTPFFIIVFITIIELLTPEGKILADIFGFSITEGSLITGLTKGIVFCGTISISNLFLKNNINLKSNTIQNGFITFNILSQMRLKKRNLLSFDYIDYLNNHSQNDISIKKESNRVSYLIIVVVFIVLILISNLL